jgi:4-amino-4-deoxy-L-arabinose transferase-like glycosyltransferase
MTNRLSPELRRLLLFVAIAALVRLATLGMYPLMDQTEARYADIARRMAELGDWVTPWIDNGVPFWGKPPLSFWMTAASFRVFGVGEFAARLPHWLCAIAIAALVGTWLDRRSHREAIYSVALLSASVLFFALAGSVMTDTALALGTTMAMRGFWLGLNESGTRRLREQGLFFLGIAIGLLAKGPLTLVLVGAPIFVWTLASGNFRRVLREIHWLAGLLIVLVLVVPWYLLAESRTPGFLEYFLVGEHWYRFTVPGWKGDLYGHAHVFPRGTIWLCALLALMPWALLMPMAVRRWSRLTESPGEDRTLIAYLACWALAPCVFFTFSGNILPTYVLPGLPAAMMIAAMMFARLPHERVERRLLPAGLATTVITSLVLVIAFGTGGWDEKTSTKALLRDFESRRTGGEALVFFPRRPLSGSFYSRGRAEQAMTVEQLQVRMAQGPVFVAVDEKHARRVPPDFPRTLRSVTRHGDYELFQAVPAGQNEEIPP